MSERKASWDDPINRYLIDNHLTPTDLVRRLVQAGTFSMPEAERLARYEKDWALNREIGGVLYGLFGEAGRITGFLFKTVESPADYCHVLDELAKITNGVLRPENIEQAVAEDDEDKVMVRFSQDGREYSFHVRHWGRYYDLDGAVDGLNNCLADMGVAGRFFYIADEDELGAVIFAPGQKFAEVAEEFHFVFGRTSLA